MMRLATSCVILLVCSTVNAADGVEAMQGTEQNLSRAQRQNDAFWAEQNALMEKWIAGAEKTFGIDPRWLEARRSDSPTRYSGTLRNSDAKNWSVGDAGCALCTFKAISRVSSTEYLAWPKTGEDVVLLRGTDMSRVVDKAEFYFPKVVSITGTFTYSAVTGAKKTVLVLDCSESAIKPFLDKVAADLEDVRKLQELAAERARKRQQAEEDAKYRTWTSTDGRTLQAKLIGFANGKATLEKRDGTQFELSPTKLSKDDQQFIREEMARRRKVDQPPAATPRPKGAARG